MTVDDIRKPIRARYLRRNADSNAEFLDAERMLERFTPLIENIVQQNRTWYMHHVTEYDIEDLRSIVQTEFLLLLERYDPSRNVDFQGYIKMFLERRVRGHIGAMRNRSSHELLTYTGNDGTCRPLEMVVDEHAERDMERVEYATSIPMNEIEDPSYRDIIQCILEENADVHTLADRYGVSPKAMLIRIEAVGRHVHQIMESAEHGQKEEGTERGQTDE